MPKYKRLVVFGCSLTKDNFIDTWANLLAKELQVPLKNYAERGAGYNYVVQKIIATQLEKDDLVVIMWPSADRYDLYVNSATPHLQNDVDQTSWLDGKTPSFVDYQGNYNQSSGWYVNGAIPRGYKHFYYKYFYNQTTHVNNAWTSIVLVQNYLSNNKIQYLMCNSYPLQYPIQYHNDEVTDFNYELYQKINFKRFVNDADKRGFIDLIKENGFSFFNPHHPNIDGHSWYVDKYIKPKLSHVDHY
jgi:hypothetical protein